MKRLHSDEQGMNALIIPLILSVLFFLGALGFGLWAYNSRQDYKNNTDQKVSAAVDVAQKQTASQKDTEFIEREKEPLKEYKGPEAYGAVDIRYPKTWSGYVAESGANLPVDGYFYPNFVPGIQSDTNFALRLQVTSRKFSEELKSFDSAVRSGKVKAQPYQPKNVSGVVGERLDGEIAHGKQGIAILIPVRDKTIKIWTEATQYEKDLLNNVLPNLNFTP